MHSPHLLYLYLYLYAPSLGALRTLCAVRVPQAGDPLFIGMLNEVRAGVCSAQTASRLAACHVSVKPLPSDGIGELQPQPSP